MLFYALFTAQSPGTNREVARRQSRKLLLDAGRLNVTGEKKGIIKNCSVIEKVGQLPGNILGLPARMRERERERGGGETEKEKERKRERKKDRDRER